MVSTAFAPSENEKAGKLTAAGAAAGGTRPAVGGGAEAVSTLGCGTFILLAWPVLGVSTLGSGGFSLGGSGFFSLVMVTESCLSFFPSKPARAANNKTTIMR